MERLGRLFLCVLRQLDARFAMLVKLGYVMDEGKLGIILGARRIAEVVRVNPLDAEEDRVLVIIGEMKDLFESLQPDYDLLTTELRWLCSQQLFDELLGRRKCLHPAIDARHREEIVGALTRHNDLRMKNPRLEDVRRTHGAIDKLLTKLAWLSVERRTRETMSPPRSKSAPVRHRSPNATNIGATTKKGSNAEIPNIGGTSRKSLQKQRRRERRRQAV